MTTSSYTTVRTASVEINPFPLGSREFAPSSGRSGPFRRRRPAVLKRTHCYSTEDSPGRPPTPTAPREDWWRSRCAFPLCLPTFRPCFGDEMHPPDWRSGTCRPAPSRAGTLRSNAGRQSRRVRLRGHFAGNALVHGRASLPQGEAGGRRAGLSAQTGSAGDPVGRKLNTVGRPPRMSRGHIWRGRFALASTHHHFSIPPCALSSSRKKAIPST